MQSENRYEIQYDAQLPHILPGLEPAIFGYGETPLTQISHNRPIFHPENRYNAYDSLYGICLYSMIGPVEGVNKSLNGLSEDARIQKYQDMHDTHMRHLDIVRAQMSDILQNLTPWMIDVDKYCDIVFAKSFLPESWVQIQNDRGEDIYAVPFIQFVGEEENVSFLYRHMIRIMIDEENDNINDYDFFTFEPVTMAFPEFGMHDHNLFYESMRRRTLDLFYTRRPDLSVHVRKFSAKRSRNNFRIAHQFPQEYSSNGVTGKSIHIPMLAVAVKIKLEYEDYENGIRVQRFLDNALSDPVHSHIYARELPDTERKIYHSIIDTLVSMNFPLMTGVDSQYYRISIPVNFEIDVSVDGGRGDIRDALMQLCFGKVRIDQILSGNNRVSFDSEKFLREYVDVTVTPSKGEIGSLKGW